MGQKGGLVRKLINFFFVFVISVSLAAGIVSYVNLTNLYMEQCMHRLHGQVNYLADLMKADGQEFVAYQKLSLEVGDKVRIPIDYNRKYHPAEKAFYDKFNSEYPGKTLGIDVDYSELSEELKVLFVTYKHEYWLTVFEYCNKHFGVLYTYYVVPTEDGTYMTYVIDLARYIEEDENGVQYILMDECIEFDKEENAALWETWEKGEQINKMDAYNNDLGRTFAGYAPLWIDGEKLGVVIAEMNIDDLLGSIRDSSIELFLMIVLFTTIIAVVMTILIGKRYISRLIKLKGEVIEYTEKKDYAIAERITEDIRGTDEIADLAVQVAAMIHEIGSHMKTLMDKNKELIEAQEREKAANELANRDSLTGIRNKTAYDSETRKFEKMMASGDAHFGLAVVDLNFLKKINDTYGHEKGNFAIKKLSYIVCHIFQHSPVYRIGGDEFVIILTGSDFAVYEDLVEEFYRVQHEMQADDSLEPWEKISAALGVAFYNPDEDKCFDDIFKKADANMYECKKGMKATRED